MQWKVLVCAAQACNEVVLESAYGTFGGIAAVNVWWDELIVHILDGEVLLEGLGSLVVKSLELGAQSRSA